MSTIDSRSGRYARVLRVATALAVAGLLLYAMSTPVLTAMGNQLIHADPVESIVILDGFVSSTADEARAFARRIGRGCRVTGSERTRSGCS